MQKSKLISGILFLLFATGISLFSQNAATLTSPEKFFGFTPGADRQLVTYEQMISYLQQLDTESPMLKLEQIGKSPMGKPMYIAFLSNEKNINNLEGLKKINHELALNPDLSEADRNQMAKDGKVFVLGTLSMHSTEVGPAQAAPVIAYKIVSSDDPEILNRMNNVVYMMVPCHNPDGMDMIVENYLKYKGTKYEGASLPRVYHKYVGHDNNRDFVILSQDDTRTIAKVYNQTWLPQVMVEKHQMGSTSARYFVPPNHDPIAENIDAGLWTWMGIFGQNMINDMTNAGLAGVSQHYIFDNYWPGSTETCLWNNVISMLTECASVNIATPIYVEPNELTARGKGLSEYKKSVNMPLPWKGGWWRLGDIVQYEITSTLSILKTASLYKERILKFRNDLCKKEVKLGHNQAPYYYIIPLRQHDQSELVNLVNLLRRHGITVYNLNADLVMKNRIYKKGDFVVPLAQPYRALIKEIMEPQEYPVRHYTPNGKVIEPYDITTWSLPLQRQVTSYEIETRNTNLENHLKKIEKDINLYVKPPESFEAAVYSINNNESFKALFIALENGMNVSRLTEDAEINGQTLPEGSFTIKNTKKTSAGWSKLENEIRFPPVYASDISSLKTKPVQTPRIALVETYFNDMDAGWTRYLFDTYHVPYTVLHPDRFPALDLKEKYDIIIFANDSKSRLMTGKYKRGGSYEMSSYPPEYVKGMGKKGFGNLMTFLDNGGVILSWGSSTALFEGLLTIPNGDNKEEFRLPFRDISSDLRKNGLNVPGSLLKINLVENNPLTLGLPESIGIFSRGRPVFATSIPRFDMDRRVIGVYADKNILMSGYADKPGKLANKSVAVWLKKGKGQLVLYGFSPQFRASTQASFKLIFNTFFLLRQ